MKERQRFFIITVGSIHGWQTNIFDKQTIKEHYSSEKKPNALL